MKERKTGLIFVDEHGNLRKKANQYTLVTGVKGFIYAGYKSHLFVYQTVGNKIK